MIHIKGNYQTLHNILEAFRNATDREEEKQIGLLIERVRVTI